MRTPLHHTRLLLGLEIRPPTGPVRRLLDRTETEALGHAAATDLARVMPEAIGGLLTFSGGLLDLTDILRPGFPAHRRLEEMAEAAMSQNGFEPQVLSIGAGSGRMPHADLMPRHRQPQGLFLCMPMLISAPLPDGEDLETLAEKMLFEHGGLGPPGLQMLRDHTGCDPVHGQILTLHDLMVLQRVQLEGAGLDAPWQILESVLIDPAARVETRSVEGLGLFWDPGEQAVTLDFLTPRDWFAQHEKGLTHYEFWLRAARQIPALLMAHGLACRWQHDTGQVISEGNATWLEISAAAEYPDSLTRHSYPDVGVVAWTRAHQGQLIEYYPLNRPAVGLLEARLTEASPVPAHTAEPPCCDESGQPIPYAECHDEKKVRH